MALNPLFPHQKKYVLCKIQFYFFILHISPQLQEYKHFSVNAKRLGTDKNNIVDFIHHIIIV